MHDDSAGIVERFHENTLAIILELVSVTYLKHNLSISGTKNIEGILLHPQRERKHIDIAIEAFREMHKLRLLEVHNFWTPKVPEYLPSELRWLIWDKFPLESLPPRFEAENLVGLQLYCSSIEWPWRGGKGFAGVRGNGTSTSLDSSDWLWSLKSLRKRLMS
ncbi:hypothetical protein LguiB_036416 [Lonicera macranthoides]